MLQGQCLCQAVTFTITQPPQRVSHCHCRMCQRQHGAAFATYLSVPHASLQLTGTGALRWYRSSPEVLRGFCQLCGSSLFWHHQQEPDDLIAVAVAALDNPPIFGEIRHLCVDERAPWCPFVEPNSV